MTLTACDESAERTLVASLTKQPWAVVIVGGGTRKTEPLLPLFEQIVNLVRCPAPQARLRSTPVAGTASRRHSGGSETQVLHHILSHRRIVAPVPAASWKT
ncbi:hypothetical protein [Streptomyces sp. NPDC056796]|uniref:hypothetical protein n=1 Tax=Streptomyces sp. NPDC056796 TaxID=3345947 RepID=UPI003688D6FD